MTRKKKIIQIPPKNVEMLARMMNVGRVTVYNQKAISDYGGIETTKTIL